MMHFKNTKQKIFFSFFSSLFLMSGVHAQTQDGNANAVNNRTNTSAPIQIKTLDKIQQLEKIKIGYTANVYPISYQVNNRLIGYGVDVCLNIAQKLKEKIPQLQLEFIPINYNNIINNLSSGAIDIECGAFVNNAINRQYVDFSVPYYISGVRIMTNNQNNTISSLNDLKNKKLLTVSNTYVANMLINENNTKMMGMEIKTSNDEATIINDLLNKNVDAFIANDFIINRINSNNNIKQTNKILDTFLTIEPIGPVFRKNDPDFKNFIDKSMIDMINNGELRVIYKKWFESPILPRNETLNIEPSFLLKDIFRMPTDIVGN